MKTNIQNEIRMTLLFANIENMPKWNYRTLKEFKNEIVSVCMSYIWGFEERQIFWKIFNGNFICSQFSPEICWEEIDEEIFSNISFWYLIWDTNPGFPSNKPANYLIDYGD